MNASHLHVHVASCLAEHQYENIIYMDIHYIHE